MYTVHNLNRGYYSCLYTPSRDRQSVYCASLLLLPLCAYTLCCCCCCCCCCRANSVSFPRQLYVQQLEAEGRAFCVAAAAAMTPASKQKQQQQQQLQQQQQREQQWGFNPRLMPEEIAAEAASDFIELQQLQQLEQQLLLQLQQQQQGDSYASTETEPLLTSPV